MSTIIPGQPGTLLVELEGQQHWLPAEIASSDDLLRQALSVVSPELANAEIKRAEGKIQVVPRRGTKGVAVPTYEDVLQMLDTMPGAIDPAILMVAVVQQLQLMHGIALVRSPHIIIHIEQAIAQSQDWSTSYQLALASLQEANGRSVVPPGF
jgi:hypothetical protein